MDIPSNEWGANGTRQWWLLDDPLQWVYYTTYGTSTPSSSPTKSSEVRGILLRRFRDHYIAHVISTRSEYLLLLKRLAS